MHLLDKNVFVSITKIQCYQISQANGNGLGLARRQAITCTNNDPGQ